jgi:HEAT repeat protein
MKIHDAVDALLVGHPDVHSHAVESLVSSGRGAIVSVLEAMRLNKRFDQRGRLGNALQQIVRLRENRDKEVLAMLSAAADTSDYTLSSNIARGISEFKGDPEARESLLRLAKNPSPQIRSMALGALYAQASDPRQEVETFRSSLRKDLDLQVQLTAARLLGRLSEGDGRGLALEVLSRPLSTSTDLSLLRAAASVAELIGDAAFIPILESLLADPRADQASGSIWNALSEVRLRNAATETDKLILLGRILEQRGHSEWAAIRLAQLGSDQAVAILRKAAADPSHPGQGDAAYALRWVDRKRQ